MSMHGRNDNECAIDPRNSNSMSITNTDPIGMNLYNYQNSSSSLLSTPEHPTYPNINSDSSNANTATTTTNAATTNITAVGGNEMLQQQQQQTSASPTDRSNFTSFHGVAGNTLTLTLTFQTAAISYPDIQVMFGLHCCPTKQSNQGDQITLTAVIPQWELTHYATHQVPIFAKVTSNLNLDLVEKWPLGLFTYLGDTPSRIPDPKQRGNVNTNTFANGGGSGSSTPNNPDQNFASPSPSPNTKRPLSSLSDDITVKKSKSYQNGSIIKDYYCKLPLRQNASRMLTILQNPDLIASIESMLDDWDGMEVSSSRRVVYFYYNADQQLVCSKKLPEYLIQHENGSEYAAISCLYWPPKDFYFTSVDGIFLLEWLLQLAFTVEEKNRIRRNLEGFDPLTVAKSRSHSADFFTIIMNLPKPKPRTIEKDIKVFLWRQLVIALTKIVARYEKINFDSNDLPSSTQFTMKRSRTASNGSSTATTPTPSPTPASFVSNSPLLTSSRSLYPTLPSGQAPLNMLMGNEYKSNSNPSEPSYLSDMNQAQNLLHNPYNMLPSPSNTLLDSKINSMAPSPNWPLLPSANFALTSSPGRPKSFMGGGMMGPGTSSSYQPAHPMHGTMPYLSVPLRSDLINPSSSSTLPSNTASSLSFDTNGSSNNTGNSGISSSISPYSGGIHTSTYPSDQYGTMPLQSSTNDVLVLPPSLYPRSGNAMRPPPPPSSFNPSHSTWDPNFSNNNSNSSNITNTNTATWAFPSGNSLL